MTERILCSTTSDEFVCPWCGSQVWVGETYYWDVQANVSACTLSCLVNLSEAIKGSSEKKLGSNRERKE